MKIPYKWLQELVGLRLSPAEAADRLTNAGIEVAAVTPLAPDVRGVVVGEIEAIERELGESHGHRLLLCRVSTGSQKFSVICGAPNTKVGVRAAFAPPGAVLPGQRRVETATIRGVPSQGMLCSERELGFGPEPEDGILVLDGDAPLGRDLVAHLGLDDHVLEVEVTPNRPDCLSVLGVARELAALTGARLRAPKIVLKEAGPPASSSRAPGSARSRSDAPPGRSASRPTRRTASSAAPTSRPSWTPRRAPQRSSRSSLGALSRAAWWTPTRGAARHGGSACGWRASSACSGWSRRGRRRGRSSPASGSRRGRRGGTSRSTCRASGAISRWRTISSRS